MTALTAYLSNQASAVAGTPTFRLYVIGGTPAVQGNGTVMGTAAAYGFIRPPGGSVWAASGSIPAQNAVGWLWDATTLEGNKLVAGSYSATIQLKSSGAGAVTLTADIYLRVSKYNAGSFTTILTMSLSGQTITTAGNMFTFSGTTGSDTNFNTGDKLYIDIIPDITNNTGAVSTQSITIQHLSNDTTGFTGDSAAAITTPGYSPQSTTNITSVTETATGSETVTDSALTRNSTSVTETATGSEIVTDSTSVVSAINTVSVTEKATGSEVVAVFQEVSSAPGAQMSAFDLAYQYARIMDSNVGPQLQLLATTYYGSATNNQAVYGELDALMSYEQIAQLHALRTANDVTAFLKAYSYAASVLADKPATYYRLGEAGGISAYDASGRNMTGTINGGVTLGQSGALAQSTDTAILFNGSTGYIALPAGVRSDNWNGLTVELWLKLTSGTFASNRRMIANSHSSVDNLGFEFFVNANGVNGSLSIGNGTTQASATFSRTFAAGTWYHVVGTYDGTTIKLYVNGALNGSSGTVAGPIATALFPVNIGRNPAYTGDYFPGSLDEIALYNKALTAARVLAHYNAGTNP